MMEGVLVLAAIAKDWKLSLPPGASSEIAVHPAISLRPRSGVHLIVQQRS